MLSEMFAKGGDQPADEVALVSKSLQQGRRLDSVPQIGHDAVESVVSNKSVSEPALTQP
jgi:hypothetical protein